MTVQNALSHRYLQTIRERQIERARKLVEAPSKLSKKKANDPKRFIEQGHCTSDGEIASKTITALNQKQIDNEAKYDGLYAVCTNCNLRRPPVGDALTSGRSAL